MATENNRPKTNIESELMSPSPAQLLIIAVIIALLFGTKKLRTIGKDVGGAVKDFKEETK